MEFTVFCNYYSYLMGARFPVYFTCSCLKPGLLEKLKSIVGEADGKTELQRRILFALHWGDCRLSYRGSGRIVFDGHEFSCAPEADGVRVRFDDDCVFTVGKDQIISYLE